MTEHLFELLFTIDRFLFNPVKYALKISFSEQTAISSLQIHCPTCWLSKLRNSCDSATTAKFAKTKRLELTKGSSNWYSISRPSSNLKYSSKVLSHILKNSQPLFKGLEEENNLRPRGSLVCVYRYVARSHEFWDIFHSSLGNVMQPDDSLLILKHITVDKSGEIIACRREVVPMSSDLFPVFQLQSYFIWITFILLQVSWRTGVTLKNPTLFVNKFQSTITEVVLVLNI